MYSSPPDPARAALAQLQAELVDVLDHTGLGPAGVLAPSTAARDWAESGAMSLTGRRAGPPQLSPGAPASWARAAGHLFGIDDRVAAALLGERAALAGLSSAAPRSAGGAFRAVATRDGWLGLSLSRPSDVALVPALVEHDAVGDAWSEITGWAAKRTTADAEARMMLLGLPGGAIGPTEPRRPAVLAMRGGPAVSRIRPLVVDFSALWAGPLCADLLARAGARVIKVESVHRPDGARFGPAAFYQLLHSGHESLALDFTAPEDEQLLQTLVRHADVVIEASRPRALEQLGLIAAEQVERGAVWVGISAYGRADGLRVGFGEDVAASAGLITVVDGIPAPVGDAIADPLTGLTAAAAARWALRSGDGWLLDVSMHDVCAHAALLPAGAPDTSCAVRAPRARAVPTQPAAPTGWHTATLRAEFGYA